jgi:hypothetical protein
MFKVISMNQKGGVAIVGFNNMEDAIDYFEISNSTAESTVWMDVVGS